MTSHDMTLLTMFFASCLSFLSLNPFTRKDRRRSLTSQLDQTNFVNRGFKISQNGNLTFLGEREEISKG